MSRPKCSAIMADGSVCGRDWRASYPVWRVGAPPISLCRTHDYFLDLLPQDRIEIVGGWLGNVWNDDAKVWTVLNTVFADRRSNRLSAHWLAVEGKVAS
jgi:hypothetical protein